MRLSCNKLPKLQPYQGSFQNRLNHLLTSFRCGTVSGGNDSGSFDPCGSRGNPILVRTAFTASRTVSAVSILKILSSLCEGCSFTFSHRFRSLSIVSKGMGSPNLTRISCPVEGKNCGGLRCSTMMFSIPEWNMGMTIGGLVGSRMSFEMPILKNRMGTEGAW